MVAQSRGQTIYDNDGDRICDETEEELRARDITSSMLFDLGCRATRTGDLCAATPLDEIADNMGCSESQKAGSFWSLELGQLRPKSVKINWLTDQRRGVEVYLPITLKKTAGVGGIGEDVGFEGMYVDCDGRARRDGQVIEGGRNYISGSGRVLDIDREDNRVVVQLRLKQLTSEEVDYRNLGDTKKEFQGIDDIEVSCETNIRSSRLVRGNKIYSRETDDQFGVIVPFDVVVFQPPNRFIEQGKEFAHGVAVTAGDWADKFNKVVKVTTLSCFSEGALTLLLWPFNEDAAKFIWYGPRAARGFPIVNAAPWSGKAMCSYTFCPADSCRALDVTTKEYAVKDAQGNVRIQPISVRGELGDRTVHSDLILSTACACVSGIEMNLRKIQVIAESWERCFDIAATTGEYINQCKEFLAQDVCKYVVGEFKDHVGVSLLKWMGRKIFEREPPRVEDPLNEFGSILAREAAITERARSKTDQTVGEIKNFYDSELKEFAGAYGRARFGFTSERDVFAYYTCHLALYKKFPSFDAFGDFDKRLGVRWETTLSGNVESYVAYIAEDTGRPVYGYKVSWSVIAGDVGTQTFRYHVYLRGPSGTRDVDEGKSRILRNPGDIERNFIEITDIVEYDQICFDNIPQKPVTCFPVGERFSEGGPSSGDPLSYIEDFFRGDDTDSDGDRLPDWWETRFNCDLFKRDFCGDLNPDRGEENKLNPNNPDSDGDGIKDDKENSDNDAFDNYHEYTGKTHPGIMDTVQAEGIRFFSCSAEVDSSTVNGGQDLGVGFKVFRPGDLIRVSLNNPRLIGENTVSERDVQVKVELKNVNTREVHYQTVSTTLENVKNGEVLELIVENDAPSGTYKVEVTLGIPGGLSLDKCGTGRGEEVRLEEQIIIHNREDGGCLDTDQGELSSVAGFCMDKDGLKVDLCQNREHQEWVCEGGRCVAKNADCEANDYYCGQGVCIKSCFDNDIENNNAAFGVCRSFVYDANKRALLVGDTKFDECASDKHIIEYSCMGGVCRAEESVFCPDLSNCVVCNVPVEFSETRISGSNRVATCAPVDSPLASSCSKPEGIVSGGSVPV